MSARPPASANPLLGPSKPSPSAVKPAGGGNSKRRGGKKSGKGNPPHPGGGASGSATGGKGKPNAAAKGKPPQQRGYNKPSTRLPMVRFKEDPPQIIETLSFSLIKQWARPANWKRGYLYHLQRQVQETQLTPTGLRAKVKGNYKEFYTTDIAFGADRLGVQCSCPLEEKWCKHAVAVALSAVEQGLWEAFWNLPEVPPELENVAAPQGLFQCQVQWPVATDARHLAKHVAVRLLERQRDAWLWQTEKTLQGYLKTLGGEELSPLLRGELGLLQWLVNEGFKQPNNPQGYFHVPMAQVGSLMERLALVEEVTDPHGNRLLVRPTPLQPHLYLGPQPNGSVNASLHWVEKGVEKGVELTEGGGIKEEYPVEELQPLGPHVPWVLTNRRIFPLAGPMAKLPKALANNTFSEFVGQEAPKFLYEQLPTLKSNWGNALVVQDEELQGISKEPKPPVACLAVEIIDPAALRTRSALTFNYEKVKVPFSRSKLEQPYLLVTTKKKDKSYWVARNLPLEHKAFQRLMDGGLQPVQANQFAADGDEAVDCYNFLLPQLEKESWAIHRVNEEHMGLLRLSPHPLKLVVRLEFDEAVTYFTLQVRATLGAKAFSLEEVQQHLLQGKKYFMASGLGFVEVPLHTVLSFNKVMQALDAETMEGGEKFKVPTYKAGLIAELEELGIELDMSRKFQRFWDVMTAGKPMEELRIPASVQAELRPYQERGFHWLWFLYSYGLNGVLADDMGLGKTLQALVVLQQAKEKHGRFPSLIVCPTTLVFNWKNEIERFTPGMKVVTLTGTERFDLYPDIKEADIVVTSYAILRRDINALKGYPFRFAILDEAQHIKNATSQTAEAAKLLQCQHRLALSGTPIENRLAELWSLFDFLMPGFLEDADQFRRRFILPIEERGSRDAESRLKRQVFPFILRRMKRDVLKDLPPKMEQVIYCDMGDNQRQLYLDILEKAKEELIEEAAAKGGKLNQQHVFAALTRLRQVCNHSSLVGAELSGGLHESGKFEALQELLEAAIANGHRILVFSQFVEMLKLVQSWLKRKGIKYEMLTGQTQKRQEAVENFNNDDSIPIFLVSLKAGGTGLNLTGADMVVHYDPWWNPAAEDQATDRVHRIGQTKSVFVYRLISRGTVEEKMMKLKARKRSLVDSIISADRSIGKKLSIEDLKDILSLD